MTLRGCLGRYLRGKGGFFCKPKNLCFVLVAIGSPSPLRSTCSCADIMQSMCESLTGCTRPACTAAGRRAVRLGVAFYLPFVCKLVRSPVNHAIYRFSGGVDLDLVATIWRVWFARGRKGSLWALRPLANKTLPILPLVLLLKLLFVTKVAKTKTFCFATLSLYLVWCKNMQIVNKSRIISYIVVIYIHLIRWFSI